MQLKQAAVVAGIAVLSFASSAANALTIGVFSENASAETNAGNLITGQGHTFVNLSNLSAGNLSGLDIAWYLNSSNDSQGQAGNAAAISSFVTAGGVFVMNDRRVTDAGSVLPGAGGIAFSRDFNDDSAIDVLNNGTSLTNGPGGIINDSTLDGGNSSSHGFATAGSLPAGAVAILSRTDTSQIVDFTYELGDGDVHYSTIPLDFYIGGGSNFGAVYAPNLLNYAIGLANGNEGQDDLPEPGMIALLGLGLVGMAAARRRRKAA